MTRSAGFLPYTFTTTSHFGYFDKSQYNTPLPTLKPNQFQLLPHGLLIGTNFADLQTRAILDAEGRAMALYTSLIPEVVVETDDVEDGNDEEEEEESLD